MDDLSNIQIERYLGQEMSKEEVLNFEQEMRDNEALHKEVLLAKQLNLHLKGVPNPAPTDGPLAKDIRSFLQTDEAKKIKENLLEVQQAYKAKKKGSKRSYFIAASVTVLLISLLTLTLINTQSPDELFANYYTESDLPSITKRNSTESPLTQGVDEFNSGAFSNALSYFNTYTTKTDSIDLNVHLYSGAAYMLLNDYDSALLEFDKIINSNTLDSSKGLWFKALLYLKQNNKKQAKTILQRILEDKRNYNYAKAKELLGEL